ncbi:HlyD family type I secretion periplasmic adaptor subunit [Limnohabitans sp.]|jgi:protease secretion system membrane fusion protein|uniref:HlyD family type I secretion periplasmic adaptor subunit n=1 Tax=Limnohabitans sp. TaxID=1907725 RepID=UPI0037BFC7A5
MTIQTSSEKNTDQLPHDEAKRVATKGLLALGIGFGLFVIWAALAPLDEGVPSSAIVSVETQRKAVQHLSGGIVREVKVTEGQEVEAGDVLFRLNEASARANFEGVRQRYLGLRAVQARLQAEQLAKTELVLHPDLLLAQTDPLIAIQVQTQQALLRTRVRSLQAELKSLTESILGQEALVASSKAMQSSRQVQLNLLTEELGQTRQLVLEGYAPRNRQLELERALADVQASLYDLQGRKEQATHSIAEMRQRIERTQQVFLQEVQSQLSSVTQEVQADADKLRALEGDLERTEITAPVSGQVVGLSVQTVGAVIQSGQKLLDIVPKDESLVLDVRIAPHLIDKVYPSLNTDVRFSTFAHSPQLVVQGQVRSVSKDLITDPQSGVTFYLARVVLTKEGMGNLQGRRLQPGMPAEVVIKTGERSMLTYLIHPLTKRFAASMKEE